MTDLTLYLHTYAACILEVSLFKYLSRIGFLRKEVIEAQPVEALGHGVPARSDSGA